MERTFVFLKPDALAQRVYGKVFDRLEQLPGLRITDAKMAMLSEGQLRTHYAHVVEKPFYPPMERFLLSAPVLMLIVEGEGAIAKVREALGPTDSSKAAPGTIRGDFGSKETIAINVAHASDSPEAAEKEIGLFFGN